MRKIIAIIIILVLAFIARLLVFNYRKAMMNRNNMMNVENERRKKLNQ